MLLSIPPPAQSYVQVTIPHLMLDMLQWVVFVAGLDCLVLCCAVWPVVVVDGCTPQIRSMTARQQQQFYTSWTQAMNGLSIGLITHLRHQPHKVNTWLIWFYLEVWALNGRPEEHRRSIWWAHHVVREWGDLTIHLNSSSAHEMNKDGLEGQAVSRPVSLVSDSRSILHIWTRVLENMVVWSM